MNSDKTHLKQTANNACKTCKRAHEIPVVFVEEKHGRHIRRYYDSVLSINLCHKRSRAGGKIDVLIHRHSEDRLQRSHCGCW